MKTDQLNAIAMNADLIVDGYAMTKDPEEGIVRVINLHRPTSSAVYDSHGRMLETTMDDVELAIVAGYLKRDAKYLEESVA